MINNIFLLGGLLLSSVLFETSIYKIKFKDLSGKQVEMASFKGKKIVIVAFNPLNPRIPQLQALDTIYKAKAQKLAVIAVPVAEWSAGMPDKDIKDLYEKNLRLGYVIAQPAKAKKKEGMEQDDLLRWLTDVKENGHFRMDAVEEGDTFLISETGTLYAVLKKKTLSANVKNLLTKQINE